MGAILFCGDVHGRFRHVIDAAHAYHPDAIVLLGDIEAERPLAVELADIADTTRILFIHGNHDSDKADYLDHLSDPQSAQGNLHGRVVEVGGIRIAGLGGIFRERIWFPPAAPHYLTYQQFCNTLHDRRPYRERHLPDTGVFSTQERTHRSSIFHSDYEALFNLRADVLVVHEAPSCHPYGFEAIDALARAMRVTTVFHGHHHDALDYKRQWENLGFRVFGVGYRGITDLQGRVIVPGA